MKAEELDKKFDDGEDVLDLFDLTTIKHPDMEDNLLHNLHVGEMLQYEFLEELDISANCLAESLRLPYLSMQQIIQDKAPMTADVDLRLCRYFGLSDGYFLRLHYAYELMEAKRNLGDILRQIVPIAALH
jgi:addiction module HigA family antidote